MNLVLVRHGRPEEPTAAAPSNPPLSAEGLTQAEITAVRLSGEPVTRIVSSGMRRADATAQPLARRLALPIETDPRLGEVDRNGGQYASMETVRARGPEHWRRFLADPIGYFGVDGSAFIAEVKAGFAAVLDGRGGTTVAFTHGFPINILLAHTLGLAEITRFIPDYASITRLRGPTLDRLTVVSINETAHFVGGAA